MPFEIPVETSKGAIRTVEMGSGDKAAKAGGGTVLAFHTWEGEIPNKPLVAAEVMDEAPDDTPEELKNALGDLLGDPVKWAQTAVGEWGADLIFLELNSTDPKGTDAPADQAAETVKKVAEAVDVPVIVYGTEDIEKDPEVLRAVASACEGMNIIIGPAKDENHKSIGGSGLAYKQGVVGMTPIDVNLAKQLNILLTNLGNEADKLIIDPTTGALGYGLEYTYSVMERLKLAALKQNDSMTQMPLLANIGIQSWKTKEAKVGTDEYPEWGDPGKRGIMWESITAVALLASGADIVVIRHPKNIELVKKMIDDLM